MAERYEYAYQECFCKLDHKRCDYDGLCDKCYWAKLKKEGENLNRE